MPIRMCISCGKKREKSDLIRLILNDRGLLVRDDDGKGPGRGAYVCLDPLCWKNLKKGGRVNRAFRKGGRIDFHPDFRLE